MFDLENLNYSVENENCLKRGPVHGKVKIPVISSIAQTIVHQYICWDGWWQETSKLCCCLARRLLPEIFSAFLGSSWRKSLIKNFRWLLPFLFVNKEASEEVSEVFTQKRKWSAQGKTQICYLSFNVLKEHKDVVKEILSGFSLLSETFLDRPVRQLCSPWMGVWLECWLTDSPILTKRNSKTSVICKSGYSQIITTSI